MDNILSQEEINALLDGMSPSDLKGVEKRRTLTDEEKDVIGEVSNIAMGAAATTLSSILSHRVEITAPKVSYSTWNELSSKYSRPCVLIQIYYKEGLDGSNILLIKDRDVKFITDLMMGGDGSDVEGELTELDLSAISEAMNQMMGTASTSLSTFISTRVDITPPTSVLVDLNDSVENFSSASFLQGEFVMVSFDMNIGDEIQTDIMQLYPFEFAHNIYNQFKAVFEGTDDTEEVNSNAPRPTNKEGTHTQIPEQGPINNQPPANNNYLQTNPNGIDSINSNNNQQPVDNYNYSTQQREDVNVQPASFQPFVPRQGAGNSNENINIIMDVPLEVRVELGRTNKSIKEILSFSPGTIVELDKLSGEPVDLLVNNKAVARGEVVVIDESFGVRISEILND